MKVALYDRLRDTLGAQQAQVIAEFVEDSASHDFSNLATKEDYLLLRADVEVLKVGQLSNKEDVRGLKAEIKELRSEIQQVKAEIHELDNKMREMEVRIMEKLASRVNTSTLIQVITTVGALIALSKLL
jgi:predicted RNase H-like nuclease (RuvC/YqgF family)